MSGSRTVRLFKSGRCLLVASANGDRTHRAAQPATATIAVTAQANDKTFTLPPAAPTPSGGTSAISLDVLSGAPGQVLVGVTQPPQGHVTVTGQRVQVSVPEGYKGTETFTYTTKDASGALHTATVTVVVPNSPPTVRGANSATVAGTGRSLAVQLADPNHDRLTVTVGQHHGAQVVVSGHELRVVPDLTFSGDLAVPVTVNDGDGGTAHTTVHVRVSPRPTPQADRYLIPSGTRLVWHSVPTTSARYAVRVNGSASCETAATSCTVGRLIGARAHVTVTVLGRDRTASAETAARPHAGRPELAGTVYFATASSVVSTHEAAVVRALTHRLTADGFTSLTVVGYTDSRGSASYNIGLSARRARAVARLVHLHTRVAVHLDWHGESSPAATNHTAHGRALNRRVELWVR
jgi:outer membrane protein OmpA-like peptidoglycan-associated protein